MFFLNFCPILEKQQKYETNIRQQKHQGISFLYCNIANFVRTNSFKIDKHIDSGTNCTDLWRDIMECTCFSDFIFYFHNVPFHWGHMEE